MKPGTHRNQHGTCKRLLNHSIVLRHLLQALPIQQWLRRHMDFLGPRRVEIRLAQRTSDGKPPVKLDELKTTEICSILEQAAALHSREILFSGNDPLHRPDLPELVQTAARLHLRSIVYTNGFLMTSQLLRTLRDAGLSSCGIYIDSPNPEKHDQLRGLSGSFEKALDVLNELEQIGLPSQLVSFIRKGTLYSGDLERLVKLGHDVQAETVRLIFPVPMDLLEDHQNELVGIIRRHSLKHYLADPIVTCEWMENLHRGKTSTEICVHSDGTVTPWAFIPLAYGNIRQEVLAGIWKRMRVFERIHEAQGLFPPCDADFHVRPLPQTRETQPIQAKSA